MSRSALGRGLSSLMEPPSGVSASGADASLPKLAQGPGTAVQRLLEQSKPIVAEPAPAKPLPSKPARIKWSLLAADVFLVLLCAALLNGVPLIAIFWKEWALATGALIFGAWLAWLAFVD